LQDPDLYDNMPEIPHAKEGLDYIRHRGHDVVLVSSCVLNGADMKMRWVVDHKMITPLRGDTLLDFVAATSKHYLRVDALIDDRDKNVKECMGYRILFDSPWNYDTNPSDYDFRMNSWLDVEEMVDRTEHFWGASQEILSADVG
jgi:5'(3')-deoxyribonucleotidase